MSHILHNNVINQSIQYLMSVQNLLYIYYVFYLKRNVKVIQKKRQIYFDKFVKLVEFENLVKKICGYDVQNMPLNYAKYFNKLDPSTKHKKK